MNNKRPWTDKEINYLITFYGEIDLVDMANHLERSISSIINKATKLRTNGVDIKKSYKGKPKGSKNKKPTKQQLLEEKKKEEQRLLYEKEKEEVERIYQRMINKPLNYGIGKEIPKLKFKHGQAYIVKPRTDKGILWTTFKGKLIFETDDFILLEGKWKECFMKKDFLIGDYEIKEVV